ncbi:MAG: hypothetical protein JO345_18565 [Streptosporangiaceae bacterium]|nr:hypothetical protein [Streptosporangiaceae bacterium]
MRESAGRARRGADAAASRPFGERLERSFYCRSCRLTVRGLWVPAGWYVLERAEGGGGRHLRVGLYCSLDCLAAAGDDLGEAEREAGARRGLPVDAGRDRARLLEIAQTLLQHGATIRAAGDKLGVPTSTLRHWLREAGVRVGPDGTLTGPADPATPVSAKNQDEHRPETASSAAATEQEAPGAAQEDPAEQRAEGKSPVQTLNELVQAGYVADLVWDAGVDGPAHRPDFRCTVTAKVTGFAGPVTGRGNGGSKAAAKTAAAAALLTAMANDDPEAEDRGPGAD